MATITRTEIDNTLLNLGLLVGLLGEKSQVGALQREQSGLETELSVTPSPKAERSAHIQQQVAALKSQITALDAITEEEVVINVDWFSDPANGIKNITSGGSDQLFDLLGQVFEKDAAENGQSQTESEDWYAITYPGDDGEAQKTPLYIVHKLKMDGAGAVINDLIGFGCKAEYGTSVVMRPYLFFPVTDKGAVVVGKSDYPIEVGLEIKRGSASGATFGTKAISFSGLRLALKIYFDRLPEISDIMLFGLALGDGITLPDVAEGQSEVGLIGLFAHAPDQLDGWMKFVFDLVLAEVSDDDTDVGSLRPVLNNLRLLLGLSAGVPGIDWGRLTSAPNEVFKKWFAQIFFEDAARKTWLNALQCLLDGKDASKTENADALGGEGSAAQPYALNVLSSWAGSSFAITFAMDAKKDLCLGLHLQSETYALAHGIGVQFAAKVDAGPFLISQDDINGAEVLPAFDLRIHVRNPAANAQNLPPLFSYIPYPPLPPLPGEPETKPPPDIPFAIGALQAGVSVGFVGGPQAPVPSLLLSGVTLGDDNFDLSLLTLKKREAGAAQTEPYAADFSADNLSTLLAVLGEALQDAWDRYQPSRYASLETNIERIVRGDDYKSIIDKLLQLSGQQVPDIPALLVELGEWIASADLEKLPRQALDWLVVEGNVFGLLGGLLSLKIREFSGAGQLLSYAPWQDFSVSLGKETSDGPFGMWLRPAAELAAVSLAGEMALVFASGFDDPPALTAAAHIGLGHTSLESLKQAGFEIEPELGLTLGSNASSFSVEFYPLGRAATDAFLMVLLPTPLAAPYLAYKDNPTEPVTAGDWFLRLAPRLLLPVFEKKLLNDDDVVGILEKSPLGADAKFTTAAVLLQWGLLAQEDDQKYRLAPMDSLSSLTATGLLKSIVTEFRASLPSSGGDFELLAIGSNGDGIYLISQQGADATVTNFGLRLRITDIAFGAKKNGKSPPSAKPALQLQLGKWMGESAQPASATQPPAETWITDSTHAKAQLEPGLTVKFLQLDDDNNPSFHFGLELVSVGLDVEGSAGKPLFSSKGYQLQGLQSRLYFAWTGEPGGPKFGAALQLKEMGIPLGPKVGGDAGKSNPVAGNLLASGDSGAGGASGAGGDTQAVNPTFSALVAYVDKFHGKIFSDIPSADGLAWLPVSRNFGPLHCRQIGLGFLSRVIDDSNPEVTEPWLAVGYDGGVALGPLNIDLDHLTIDIPLRTPQQISRYELGLAGLDVSYAGGPISISGGFLKSVGADGQIEYSGMALIKAADFTITGFGSYAVIGDEPSLFIFAVLHKDLGGPSFFHVTGLAAGFGYNRALRLPPIEEVHTFPLVRGALEDNYFDGSSPDKSIVGAMRKLHDYIPPSRGEYWFALGVRFTSFEMIHSFALLSVSFGHEVQIALLGMSKLSVPGDAKPGEAIVYAELAIKAVIKPEEGTLAIEGRLTDESYVYSKDCHLTGGFAFYSWFSGPHAGDFVITLGGYHPKFDRPEHYPVVPRLAINWQVSDELTVTAELYFALTPSCLMAGGKLSAVYQVSCIKAWFTAYADFLLSWKPFYYLVDMGIEIGVEATVRIPLGFCTISISISVHLSVKLHIWGPEFAGSIEVDLSVISFTVSFGPAKAPPAPIAAQEFVKSFLPPPLEVLGTQITGGLIRQENQTDGRLLRVVNAHALTLTSQTLIPVTTFDGLAPTSPADAPPDTDELGIRSMGKVSLSSTLTVTINGVASDEENLRVVRVKSGVPDALWGKSSTAGVVPLPDAPAAHTFETQSGVRISFAPKHPQGALPPIEIEKFAYETFDKPIPWDPTLKAAGTLSTQQSQTPATMMEKATVARRQAVLDVLALDSRFVLNEVDLRRQVAAGNSYFQDEPDIGLLGAHAERYVPK